MPILNQTQRRGHFCEVGAAIATSAYAQIKFSAAMKANALTALNSAATSHLIPAELTMVTVFHNEQRLEFRDLILPTALDWQRRCFQSRLVCGLFDLGQSHPEVTTLR